jgi:pyrrolidone-carboxylate peptidase
MDYIAEKQLDIPAGFIHIPRLPENAVGLNKPSMSLETSTKALEIAVSLVADHL